MNNCLVSFCIPTNGMVDWVMHVVESIYDNCVDNNLFEVVITDNGIDNSLEIALKKYIDKHNNLRYKRTTAKQFLNQIEAFRLAKGEMIKFVNHRMKFLPGAVKYYVDYVEKYKCSKPITYFLNGAIKYEDEILTYEKFDSYVKALSYWSSWSAGTAIWKIDFDNIDTCKEFNSLFPHIDLVFSEKNKQQYNIVNVKLMEEINVDSTKKGKYDLFYAFAVEYLRIIEGLFIQQYISRSTFDYIKRENLKFISDLYWEFIILKKPNSYDLLGYEKAINVYYSKRQLWLQLIGSVCKKICNKVFRRNTKSN